MPVMDSGPGPTTIDTAGKEWDEAQRVDDKSLTVAALLRFEMGGDILWDAPFDADQAPRQSLPGSVALESSHDESSLRLHAQSQSGGEKFRRSRVQLAIDLQRRLLFLFCSLSIFRRLNSHVVNQEAQQYQCSLRS